VVTELKSRYAFDLEIVKKKSFGLLQRMSLPNFPAIEIDGIVVLGGCDIMQEQLDAAVKERH
jgi:hypothetical protein